MMRRFRRYIAIVTGLSVAQLTLLGAAVPCTGGPVDQSPASPAAHHVPASDGSSDCAEHAGEQREQAPAGAQSCFAMTACATPLLQVAATVTIQSNVVVSRTIEPAQIAPATRTAVPEPPPPRA